MRDLAALEDDHARGKRQKVVLVRHKQTRLVLQDAQQTLFKDVLADMSI